MSRSARETLELVVGRRAAGSFWVLLEVVDGPAADDWREHVVVVEPIG